jgi:hypothetical protein
MSERRGGCLCGAVRFAARIDEPRILACHCVQCQRWTGGGPLLTVRVRDLRLEGEAALRSHRASAWGERLFCGECGAPVTWRMAGDATRYLPVGLLDDQSGLRVTEEIFVDRRPGWLPPWHGATQSTEAEEEAKLAAQMAGDKP